MRTRTFRVGDPAVGVDWKAKPCTAVSPPLSVWYPVPLSCSLGEGHRGAHVASGVKEVLRVWNEAGFMDTGIVSYPVWPRLRAFLKQWGLVLILLLNVFIQIGFLIARH